MLFLEVSFPVDINSRVHSYMPQKHPLRHWSKIWHWENLSHWANEKFPASWRYWSDHRTLSSKCLQWTGNWDILDLQKLITYVEICLCCRHVLMNHSDAPCKRKKIKYAKPKFSPLELVDSLVSHPPNYKWLPAI